MELYQYLEPANIRCLRVNSLQLVDVDIELYKEEYWFYRILYSNRKTLRTLELGVESLLIEQFSAGKSYDDSHPSNTSVGAHFFKTTSELLDHYDEDKEEPLLTLESLKMCGISLKPLPELQPLCFVDIGNLTHLTLESCCAVDDALARLTPIPSDPDTSYTLRLRTFKLRQEIGVERRYLNRLKTFLCSFSGLTDLWVLIESKRPDKILLPILRVHGETLRTLIWDTSTAKENLSAEVPSEHTDCGQLGQLTLLSPHLVELGLTLDWTVVTDWQVRRGPILKFLSTHMLITTRLLLVWDDWKICGL